MYSFHDPNLLSMTLAMVANFTVILAAMVFQFVLLNGQISLNQKRWWPLFGLVFGVFSIISMMAPIRIDEGIVVDARFILTLIATIFGGPISGLITATIASIYRWNMGGIGFYASVPTLISAILIGLGYLQLRIPVEHRSTRMIAFFGAGFLLFLFQVLSGLVFLFFLPWEKVVQVIWDNNLPAFFLYPPITLIMGVCLDFILARHQLGVERELLVKDLERHNQELDIFNSVLQHEFRSPIVSIQGFLGELDEHLLEGNAEAVKTDVEYLHDSANRLSSLVLALTHYNNARAEWPQPINPVATLLHKLALRWPTVKIQSEINSSICCGVHEFTQIFDPVINNAIQFSIPGPSNEIIVTVSQEKPYVVFLIKDKGIGMNATTQENAFNLFYRSSTSPSGSHASLATVKRLIHAIHGKISIHSAGINQGCTVSIYLLEKSV